MATQPDPPPIPVYRFVGHSGSGKTTLLERLVAALRADQLHFLEHHLARWAPHFGATLQDVALTPLYRTYGEALTQFVLQDLQTLADATPA